MQRQHHDRGVERHDGCPLAGSELERARGCGQQRLQRCSLALAGGGVERRGEPAHQRREEPVKSDEEQHDRAAALRRGEVVDLDVQRIAATSGDTPRSTRRPRPHSRLNARSSASVCSIDARARSRERS